MLVFPDTKHTEWIAWKKITKKPAGIEPNRHRSTAERFAEYTSTLPSLNISPLHMSLRPLHSHRHSSPRPLNANLLIQLPPFSGSLKSRHTATNIPNSRNFHRDSIYSAKDVKSETIPRANFIIPRDTTANKGNSTRKIKRFLKVRKNLKQKLEGIVGVKLLNDLSIDGEERSVIKSKKH